VPHCTKCGSEVPASAQFCATCGQPQPASAWQPTAAPVAQSGMSETTAAILSYVLGWLTGIIFLLIDRRPYVRFHAAQSVVTFGGLHVIRIVIAGFFGFGWWTRGFGLGYGHVGGFGLGLMLLVLLGIVGFVLWIVCMIKAAQGVRFMVPIAGEIAQNLAGG
jgi:uncharacterized membrane protein